MSKIRKYAFTLALLTSALIVAYLRLQMHDVPQVNIQGKESFAQDSKTIKLLEPAYDSPTSIEKALLERRSKRSYKDVPVSLKEVSQLLWAAQGITDARGFRTAPSAGALYPLEVYVVAAEVEGLSKGVYKYRPHPHELVKVIEADVRDELSHVALRQAWVRDGAVVIVFAAVYERTTRKYGERGIGYVHIEVGCAAQNVYLQAVSLNLGTVFVGAFYDDQVKEVLHMKENEQPLGIMSVGRL